MQGIRRDEMSRVIEIPRQRGGLDVTVRPLGIVDGIFGMVDQQHLLHVRILCSMGKTSE
jgi:hypothetical protein